MQATIVPGVSTWSRWQADKSMYFNSWFVETADGNMLVDPLEPDDAVIAFIAGRGVNAIVLTNRDHERFAATFAERFSAPVFAAAPDAAEICVRVDRILAAGDDVFGWTVVMFEGFKTPGELALVHAANKAAITGDAFWGVPAGSLRLMPDDKLADPVRAALSARRLLPLGLKHLLVGDGMPVYERAHQALLAMLDARTDVFMRRINLDELHYNQRVNHGPYRASAAEIGLLIGAEKLGYLLGRLEPGSSYCPLHWHTREEEIYLVWSGAPTLRTPAGSYPLRRGDVVSFATSAEGAHSLSNNTSEPCEVLMFSNIDAGDVCYYPDSEKVLVRGATRTMVRSKPQLDYFDGE